MKKQINAKITSTKKFVSTHKTKIALATGVTVGAATALVIKHYIDDQKTLLLVTDDLVNHMQSTEHSVGYDTPYGTIHTFMLPTHQDTNQ